MNEVKFGSVCSGIEAASVAWNPLGWEAAWLSEIEPFPSAVLAHHYPDTPNLGDMTKLVQRINYAEVEAPELFCGGTPCQAFSVAGLRKSLDDARGNLSLVFCEVADVIDSVRNVWGEQPAIIFWENVPGVLNTGDNAFGCFLAGLAGEDEALQPPGGKWTNAGCVFGPKRAVAWRVLDAQYFGVAQRRKRVFVVASARAGFNPATILFEFEGLRRDTAPSRSEGQAVTPSVTSGAPFSRTGNQWVEADAIVPSVTSGARIGGTEQPYSVANCLTARMHKGINSTLDEGQTPVLATYAIQGSVIGRNDSAGPQGDGINVDLCFTQNTTDRHAVAYGIPGNWIGRQPENGGNAVEPMHNIAPCLTKTDVHGVAHPIAFHPTQDPISSDDGTTHSMGCGSSGGQASIAVAYESNCLNPEQPQVWSVYATDGVAPTTNAGESRGNAILTFDMAQITSPHNRSKVSSELPCSTISSGSNMHLASSMAVRRLTPTECERLQGFPDGYTAIPWRNKASTDCPDGPRYKALGNSWATPVVRWIGERINKELGNE